MNIKIAAKNTKELVADISMPIFPEQFSRKHVNYMLDEIVSGNVNGEKAHRWLGWAQAAACSKGGATFEEMKEINFKA